MADKDNRDAIRALLKPYNVMVKLLEKDITSQAGMTFDGLAVSMYDSFSADGSEFNQSFSSLESFQSLMDKIKSSACSIAQGRKEYYDGDASKLVTSLTNVMKEVPTFNMENLPDFVAKMKAVESKLLKNFEQCAGLIMSIEKDTDAFSCAADGLCDYVKDM